ncbi:J domain-containing protein [Candidatus Woesearchaeota archaeon]|nr:J domain-containing protein [Candidatus Woesearchaeota archaeon]
MANTITLKGHNITPLLIRDSYDRRAVGYRNSIYETLKLIGFKKDDIDMKEDINAYRFAPASVAFYIDGHRLYYSYKLAKKYVENLYIVFKVIDLEVKAVLSGEKTMREFIATFTEDKDVEGERKEARRLLGLADDVTDMNVINAKYKELAKSNHPDMNGGNQEKFKAINNAHKVLKRELE